MKKTAIAIALSMLAFVVVGTGMTQLRKRSTVTFTTPRTAVDLELIVERDAEGNVVKVHRLRLWSDGRIDFPDIPYYARLVFSCRDCPTQPNPCPEDIDGDGKITVVDLLRLNSKMGQKCPDA